MVLNHKNIKYHNRVGFTCEVRGDWGRKIPLPDSSASATTFDKIRRKDNAQ